MERRTLQSSYFVPPPAVGVIDDFVVCTASAITIRETDRAYCTYRGH
jgi:hypothetical protein